MANYIYPNLNSSSGPFQEEILSQTEGIDFATIGDTAIYTPDTGTSAIVTKAIIFIDDAVGIGGTMDAGIGFNVTVDNIIPTKTLTGFSDNNQNIFIMLNQDNTYIAGGGDVVSFRVGSAFTGVVTGSVVLFGIVASD